MAARRWLVAEQVLHPVIATISHEGRAEMKRATFNILLIAAGLAALGSLACASEEEGTKRSRTPYDQLACTMMGTVTARPALNVRLRSSLSSTIIGQISYSTLVCVLELESESGSSSTEWAQIQGPFTLNGVTHDVGYVAARWLKTQEARGILQTAQKPERQVDDPLACSPTALFMVLNYLAPKARNRDSSLLTYRDLMKEVADEKYGPGRFNPGTGEGQNPVGTSLQVITQVAQHYADLNGLTVSAGEGWSLSRIASEIAKDHPVMINYGGCSGRTRVGYGHSILIYGVDWDNNQLLKVDGLFSGETLSFSEFNLKWEYSDCGDPLQPAGYERWALVVHR
jgi:hypothetical protein